MKKIQMVDLKSQYQKLKEKLIVQYRKLLILLHLLMGLP